MERDLETTVTGWYLLAAAAVTWLTWTLLPHHLGTYLEPRWLAGAGALLGGAAMALTMGLPDDLHLYAPIFHGNALWLAALGVVLLRSRSRAATGQ